MCGCTKSSIQRPAAAASTGSAVSRVASRISSSIACRAVVEQRQQNAAVGAKCTTKHVTGAESGVQHRIAGAAVALSSAAVAASLFLTPVAFADLNRYEADAGGEWRARVCVVAGGAAARCVVRACSVWRGPCRACAACALLLIEAQQLLSTDPRAHSPPTAIVTFTRHPRLTFNCNCLIAACRRVWAGQRDAVWRG